MSNPSSPNTEKTDSNPQNKNQESITDLASFAVHDMEKRFISLEITRQWRLILGFLILLGLLSDIFGKLIMILVGILFLFEGFSGKVILEPMIKKFPWNQKKK